MAKILVLSVLEVKEKNLLLLNFFISMWILKRELNKTEYFEIHL
jgi:hypothetical protein